VRWSRRPRKRVPAERGRRSRDGGLQEKRQLIEGVIDQLKNIFALERHRAKTLGGLLTRLAAKVAAYACGQILSRRLRRPAKWRMGLPI
jgi:hypothetical protein